MLSAGDVFLIPDDPKDSSYQRHFWIIISDPTQSSQVLLVNVTTLENWNRDDSRIDDSCILEPKECKSCSFIKHTSRVDYHRARIESSEKIEKMVAAGLIKRRSTIGPQLLAKIRAGAQVSEFLPNKCQLFLADQGLLEL